MSIRAMHWVFENAHATLGPRLVLLALADFAHDDGTRAYASVDRIATKARLSRRGVQYALRKLEKDGEIEPTGRTRPGTVVYRITGIGGADFARADIARGAKSDTRGATASPKPLVEPSASSPYGEDNRLFAASAAVRDIFEHWRQVMGKNGRAKLSPDRNAKIVARLGEGYSVDRIKRAIDGCAASEFHRSKGHIGLDLICRNASKLEAFEAMPVSHETDHEKEITEAIRRAG